MALSLAFSDWNFFKSAKTNFLITLKLVAISIKDDSEESALLVTDSGELFTVGKSKLFLLGIKDLNKTLETVKIQGIFNVAGVSICNKYGDALAFTHQGQLYTWGANANCETPTAQSALNGITIVDAVCSEGHYLALTQDGKVYEWRGTTFNGVSETSITPTLQEINVKIVAIACGDRQSLAVTQDGNVFVWGSMYNSYTGGYPKILLSEVRISNEIVIKVTNSLGYCLALTKNGKIYSWYCACNYSSGNSFKLSATPLQIAPNIRRFSDIFENNGKCAAITEMGNIYTWTKDNGTLVKSNFMTIQQVFACDRPFKLFWVYKDSDSITIDTGVGSFEEEAKECFNKKESSDLTFVVQNKRIYVHKFLLNVRSKFFQTMLQEHWEVQSEVKLTSFSYEVYLSYLWYIYTREIKSSTENLLELWSLGHAYEEDKLQKGVEQLIKKNLSVQNLCLLYSKTLMINRNSFERKIDNLKESNPESAEEIEGKFKGEIEKLNKVDTQQEKSLQRLENNITELKDKVEDQQKVMTELQEKVEDQRNIITELKDKVEYL